MSRLRIWMARLAVGLAGLVASAGCVQMPTEKQAEVDLRAQISFQLASERAHTAIVWLDGLDMGYANQFPENVASLRILSGTHHLRLLSGKETLLDERFYIGEGVHRIFVAR